MSLSRDVDDVHDMMDDISEQNEIAEEISSALSTPIGFNQEIDDVRRVVTTTDNGLSCLVQPQKYGNTQLSVLYAAKTAMNLLGTPCLQQGRSLYFDRLTPFGTDGCFSEYTQDSLQKTKVLSFRKTNSRETSTAI